MVHFKRLLASTGEMLVSMRFAIALLILVALASVIGTVLNQNEPLAYYVGLFGEWWARVFWALGLQSVYGTAWFIGILAVLMLSTSLCVMRNTPKVLHEFKSFQERIHINGLRGLHHHAVGELNAKSIEQAASDVQTHLEKLGFITRHSTRQDGVLIAAKKGQASRLGYIAAHSAIVLIGLGGIFDGPWMQSQLAFWQGKTPYLGQGLISQVSNEHRLGSDAFSFRAQLFVPEGSQAHTAIIQQPRGVYLQDLPFSIELKRFIVEYHSTGSPKRFASDIVIHDPARAQPFAARVEVNHPVTYKGVNIFQSSFADGGSALKVQIWPWRNAKSESMQPMLVETTVGKTQALSNGWQIEYSDLRAVNVENFADAGQVQQGQPESWAQHLQDLKAVQPKKEFHNVGPSIEYTLRDASGQAYQFHHYMLPVTGLADYPLFLLGVRTSPAESYRYLRVPADANSSLDGFLYLYAALQDPAMRKAAAESYLQTIGSGMASQERAEILQTSQVLFARFAQSNEQGGLNSIAQWLQTRVPEQEREKAAALMMKLLTGLTTELWHRAQAQHHQTGFTKPEEESRFIQYAVAALSDARFYPTPFVVSLKSFDQVNASVFQVSRAPGAKWVYLGCALLVLGIFAMLYLKNRRVWVLLRAKPEEGRAGYFEAILALSTTRMTTEVDREFQVLKDQLFSTDDRSSSIASP